MGILEDFIEEIREELFQADNELKNLKDFEMVELEELTDEEMERINSETW